MEIRKKLFLRKNFILFLTMLCAILLLGCSSQSESVVAKNDRIVSDEIIISFQDFASREQIDDFLSGQEVVVDGTLSDIGMYRLILPVPLSEEELELLAETLRDNSIVDKTYLNTVVTMENASVKGYFCPNDPWSGEYWDTNVPGGKNWGIEAIDAPGAWRYLDFMTNVNVGIIESHVPNHLHPDLKDGFVNRQCLLIDKDGNYKEIDPGMMKPDRHSTRVASVINAAFNNDEGVTGVMGGKGKLYSYAIEYAEDNKDELFYKEDITCYTYLTALKALIDQDVQVINISMGDYLSSAAASYGSQPALDFIARQTELSTDILMKILEERKANNKSDFVIVVCAGNANDETFYKDEEAPLKYREDPTFWEIVQDLFGKKLDNAVRGGVDARYNHFLSAIEEPQLKDRIIVVGSVGIDKKNSTETATEYQYSGFSNIGDRVDLVAPGENIYGCNVKGYGTFGGTGTSFSSPHVAGAAGLVFACDPTLSGPQVKEILLSTATGSYAYGEDASGMVNANLAVTKTLELLEEMEQDKEDTDQKKEETDQKQEGLTNRPDKEVPPHLDEKEEVEDTPQEESQNQLQDKPQDKPIVEDESKVIYPDGNWNDHHKVYFDYLKTKLYVDHISNPIIQEVCREQYIDNYYTFRDLDFNGTDELILWLGYTGADGEIMIFTIENGDVCYEGSVFCDGTGTGLVCADHDYEFFLVSFDGDREYGTACKYLDGKLQILYSDYEIVPFRWGPVDWLGSLPLK